MAAPRNVDIKIDFERHDCVPGHRGWATFEERSLAAAQRTDEHGWSHSDVCQGIDLGGAHNGGPAAAFIVAPGAPALANNAEQRKTVCFRSKRVKESFSYLLAHLNNDSVKSEL